MINQNEKDYYTLTDKDKKDLKAFPDHFTGKAREFITSFCNNIVKYDKISYKQYLVFRSIKSQRDSMYKPTKDDKYESPIDEWQRYD